MRNIQKVSSKIQNTVKFRTTILFLFGGLGVFFILFIIGFVFYNLGRADNSYGAGSISSIKSGQWNDDMTWHLHRKPGNNEEIIIGREELVTIDNNVLLENVTIKIYGTLTLSSGKLRLDETSTILIANTGSINSEVGSNSLISFGTEGGSWLGNQINSIGAPGQLTSSGESSIDLLPVHLDYFKGEVTDNNEILLEWETFSEQNNAFFTIEKRTGETDFIMLDTIKGAGNSNLRSKYQFVDKSLNTEAVYYRLKQTDFDGNMESFNIIYIVAKDHGKPLKANAIKINQAGPNPFSESFTISYTSSEKNKVEINISSMEGKIVHREILETSQGENKYTFNNVNQIASGLYVVTFVNSGKSDFVKMIKM